MNSRSFARFLLLACSAIALTTAAGTLVSDFEDTGLVPTSYWNGDDGSGGFHSHNVFYNNDYVDWGGGFYSWSGFAMSRVNDTTTPGPDNQYAVWGDGTDVSGGGTYAIAFVDEAWGVVPTLTLPCPALVQGFYVNNTTYAALAIRDGEYSARKFSVDAGDWFRLTITGRDAGGASVGTVEVMLADYRVSAFLLDQWRWVDLTSLGSAVRTLEFRLDSTDNGIYGMNTPAYFAMDGLELVPQPLQTVATLDAVPSIPAGQDYWNGSDGSGGFLDSAVHFKNVFTDWGGGFTSWSGFALSRVNDATTPGPDNQYAVWGDGQDAFGDGQYAVVYDSFDDDLVTFPYDTRMEGFYVNNTTYAALSMRDGDAYAKKFGGASGNDPDWFLLTVIGKNSGGMTLGTTNVYLADYRFADNSKDYILSDWTWVDLSSFVPGVRTLHFALTSSDNGTWGMNTPAYFALDTLTYRYAPGGAHDDEGSLLDQGIPGFVIVDDVEVLNPQFGGWATTVIDYSAAPAVDEDWSDPSKALGPVTGDRFDIVSLGDLDATQIAADMPPGSITLGFEVPIRNGNGPDFAVFENGFVNEADGRFFAELAYVEVSSDGIHFVRFPSRSDTAKAVGPYGNIRARNVHNLAGKHGNGYGTPFDLADLANDPLVRSGHVDLGNITQVRIVDIPGDGSFLDSYGQPIYDAWVTWGSGGFDLEAVGVLNAVLPGMTDRGVSLSWIADQRLVGSPTDAQERDLDNDGHTAWEEFFGGTDANDPTSLLQVTDVDVNADGLTVTWQGSRRGSDIDFTLQRRSSLTAGDWTDSEIVVPRGAGNVQTWQGAVPAGKGAFFRVIVNAPDPL